MTFEDLPPMPVLEEILAWSNSLEPLWMRDALRRIVVQAEITETDIEELTELCKKPQGLSTATIEVSPLIIDHLPADHEKGSVGLVALTHVSDVNALAPNESIEFGKTGLTIVYGVNGAGKSGYGRILKRACRARGSSDVILANALSEKPAGPPTAKFIIDVAGNEHCYIWKDGLPGHRDLGAISVFDSSAAQVYVSDKTEVRFRPFGLDVMDKLAGVCSRIESRLNSEQSLLQFQLVTWPTFPQNTEAGRLLANLTALTKREDVGRVATLTQEERCEFEALTEVIATAKSENPEKKALDYRVKASRLRRLIKELNSLSTLLGDTSVAQFVRLRDEASNAAKVARNAAEKFGNQVAFTGLGSSAWRGLWESARVYSEKCAYPDLAFPHIEEGAKCVLCQQGMEVSTKERLAKLEEFVRGIAQAEAIAKQKIFEEFSFKYHALVIEENVKDALDDLAVLNPDVYIATTGFLEAAKTARASLIGDSLVATSISTAPPIAVLETLATSIEVRAAEITKAANPVERKRSEERLLELKSRSTLEAILPQIYAEIDRKSRMNAYDQCLKTTNTRTLTKLSTELTKKYVTDALTIAFDDELRLLGFVAPELELRAAGGQKGVLYHQVFLKRTTKAELGKVVSEGESRCIALAAFLAEIRSAAHASAIVFDDPVSSLDHRWRTNVSKRLVEEAKTRQVIVFTHEIVFVAALVEEAKRLEVLCNTQTVSRGADLMAGHINAGLPWEGKRTGERIDALKQDLGRAERIYKEHGENEYGPMATRIYACLRQTWERAVEEVLLENAVVRYRRNIDTKFMKNFHDITEEDISVIREGIGKASKWEGGHDQPLAAYEPLPIPSEVKIDIEKLEHWVQQVRARRKDQSSL